MYHKGGINLKYKVNLIHDMTGKKTRVPLFKGNHKQCLDYINGFREAEKFSNRFSRLELKLNRGEE